MIMSEVRHLVCSADRFYYTRISPDRASENVTVHFSQKGQALHLYSLPV